MQKERIAIIGAGCRFPGGVSSKDCLWKLLVEGREGVVEVPPDRWNVERYYDAEPGVAGKSIALRGGFIDAIDQFDPQFFGISPREAPYVDREATRHCEERRSPSTFPTDSLRRSSQSRPARILESVRRPSFDDTSALVLRKTPSGHSSTR